MPALLGPLAALLSILLVWPQVQLSCRKRRTAGLSATTCWLNAALNVSWAAYGLLVGDRAQVVSNAVVGVANGAILLALLAQRPQLRTRRSVLSAGWGAGALLACAGAALGAAELTRIDPATAGAALGAVTSVVGALAALPQPIDLLRNRAADLSGLSGLRWSLAVAASLAWTCYGLEIGQPAVWAAAAVGMACACVVCAVLLEARFRTAAGVGESLAAAPTRASVALAA